MAVTEMPDHKHCANVMKTAGLTGCGNVGHGTAPPPLLPSPLLSPPGRPRAHLQAEAGALRLRARLLAKSRAG